MASPGNEADRSAMPQGIAGAVGADAAAVRRVLAGDREAFALLVRAHQGALLAVLRTHVPDHDTAEDLAQEALVRAYRGLAGFDAARPFRPWLIRIGLNLVRDHQRRRGIPVMSLDDPAAAAAERHSAEPAVLGTLDDEDQRRVLGDAVARLSEQDRDLLHLHYTEGLAVEAIATRRQSSAGATRTALHRARERVRQFIFGGDPS